MFYFPFPTNCMSKGKPLGVCKTCGSEIVESVNDGVFRGGECDFCERLRYESQPVLLEALDDLLRQTVDLHLECGIELTKREKVARARALAAIATACGQVT